MKVVLEHQISSFGKFKRKSGGQQMRLGTNSNATQRQHVAGYLHSGHGRFAGILFGFNFLRVFGGVSKVKNMMNHLARRRPEFNSANPFIIGKVQWNAEIAVNVGTVSGHGERFVHLDNQVWRAKLPAISEFGQRGQFLWIAFRHALLHPGLDCL